MMRFNVFFCFLVIAIPPLWGKNCPARGRAGGVQLDNAVGISQSAVSHQLRVLRTSKLVKFRREGKAMLYSLDDDHVRSMLELGMEHVEE